MGGSSSPCASCKLLRRRCAKDCIFAPFFPSDDPHKFAIVHKVFGASNVSKMLQDIPVHQRADAVSSLVFEANARLSDPVYGCVGAISYLQNQVSQLQMQLAVAQAEILCFQMQQQQQQQQHGSQLQSLKNINDDNFVDDKSYCLHDYEMNSNSNSSSSSISIITQLMDFASSTNVVQEPFTKSESLWA